MLKKVFSFSMAVLLSLASQQALAYLTKNNGIYDENGIRIPIDGSNWAGFQDSNFIDELYGAVPFYRLTNRSEIGVIDMLTHPWENQGPTGVSTTSGVAFKTIRLPIQPLNLTNNTENKHFRMDLTSAVNKREGNGVFCARWDSQYCVQGLSVKESFYQLLQEFKNNQIRVLVDFHQTPAGRNGNVTTGSYSLASYGESIANLAEQIKVRHLDNVMGIDVFNEPHNLHWYQNNGNQPAWIEVIAKAAQQVYDHNPNLLLFVEGPSSDDSATSPTICVSKNTPQDPNAYALFANAACGPDNYAAAFKSNWGENFKDLLDPNEALQGRAIFDDVKFRHAVCSKLTSTACQWLLGDASHAGGHLVFSPHIYGQHVASWQSTPQSSPYRFDWNFGFLAKAGFPLVIGEAGYIPAQLSDANFFRQSIMPYLQSHHLNHDLFYWTFNSNSGDTGGIRESASSARLVLEKEQDLHDLFSQ